MKRNHLAQSISLASIAACSGKKDKPVVAACAFDLLADPAGGWQQILPAGNFHARDGRPHDAPNWVLNASLATAVIQRFTQRTNDAVVDYEHQTLHSEANGAAAPAAGWMKELEWREGAGLFARVEWTAKARQMIRDGEYRYLSPVFQYTPGTGEVLTVEMAAVTNYPGLDGMQALAAMRSNHNDSEEDPVNLLQMLIGLMALDANISEEDAFAALKQKLGDLEEEAKVLAALRQELKLDEGAGLDAVKTSLAALKSAPPANPDPSKYVPVNVVEDLRTEIAALTGRINTDEVQGLVAEALEDGRLLPAQEPWARDLGKTNVEALKAYLKTAQPIAALRKTQTGGQQQVNDDGLTDDELAVCRSMGIEPGEYLKSKPGYKPVAEK